MDKARWALCKFQDLRKTQISEVAKRLLDPTGFVITHTRWGGLARIFIKSGVFPQVHPTWPTLGEYLPGFHFQGNSCPHAFPQTSEIWPSRRI